MSCSVPPSLTFTSMTRGSDEELLPEKVLLCSDFPKELIGVDLEVGIDEAGRGSVLGPMVYSCAYWPVAKSEEMAKKGFDDSKALTAESRMQLFQKIQDNRDSLGYVIKPLQSKEISASMLQTDPYNLNNLSHDAAIECLAKVLEMGGKVAKCFVDTVGPPDSYKRKFEERLSKHNIEFVVEKKADSKYKVVSAASICAKVTRDEMIDHWRFREKGYEVRTPPEML